MWPKDDPAFIYFITRPSFGKGLIKVGYSWNPWYRIQNLGPRKNKLQIVSVFEFENKYRAMAEELRILKFFKGQTAKGREWFKPSSSLIHLALMGDRSKTIRGEARFVAKRFTDTEKWAKPTFHHLSMKMKLVWIYLCDNCDHSGIWDANLPLLSFQVGETVTVKEIDQAFGDKIKWLDSGKKIFLESFVEFQYGALNPENRVHKSVIDRLERQGAYKALTRPLQGAKDKDKDKDKVKDLDKDKDKEKENCEKNQNFQPEDLLKFWNANCSTLPKARWTQPRKTKAKTQFKKYPAIEHWREALEGFTSSDFCLNKWRPSFDDFLSESKRIRSIEGSYANFGHNTPETREQRVSRANAELYQAMILDEQEEREVIEHES